MAKCQECGRTFDLTDETQAEEFYYGHDCEDVQPVSVRGETWYVSTSFATATDD